MILRGRKSLFHEKTQKELRLLKEQKQRKSKIAVFKYIRMVKPETGRNYVSLRIVLAREQVGTNCPGINLSWKGNESEILFFRKTILGNALLLYNSILYFSLLDDVATCCKSITRSLSLFYVHLLLSMNMWMLACIYLYFFSLKLQFTWDYLNTDAKDANIYTIARV